MPFNANLQRDTFWKKCRRTVNSISIRKLRALKKPLAQSPRPFGKINFLQNIPCTVAFHTLYKIYYCYGLEKAYPEQWCPDLQCLRTQWRCTNCWSPVPTLRCSTHSPVWYTRRSVDPLSVCFPRTLHNIPLVILQPYSRLAYNTSHNLLYSKTV